MKRKTASKPKIEAVKTATRTLLLTTSDGDVRITIPPGARVTFGPTIPFEKKAREYGKPEGYSLRVYESALNSSLIAVFSDVKAFRDISIPHAKLIVREAGKAVWKSDEEGYKVETEVKNSKHWADPLHQLENGNDD